MGIDVKVESGTAGSGGVDGGVVEANKKQPQQQGGGGGSKMVTGSDKNNNSNNKYWMRDPYSRGGYSSYQPPRGYGGASGLYNLAWAQAVQNKPLNEVFVELKKDNNSNTDNNNDKSNGDETGAGDAELLANDKKNVDRSKNGEEDDGGGGGGGGGGDDESEKEEGELEEGEIDGEFEDDTNNNGSSGGSGKGNNNVKEDYMRDNDDVELEIQVSSIRKVLENVTPSQANKSFDIVCARLRSSLESLRELVLHTWFPSKDALIQQAFSAIYSIYSVFTDMTPALRDQNRDKFSRLLTFVSSLSSVLFSPDQRKQVEDMIAFVSPPPPAPVKPKPRERQEELPVTEKAILTDANTLSVNSSDSAPDYLKRVGLDANVHQSDKSNNNILSDAMKQFQFQSNLKTRGGFNPLLDLHKVHDEDSLPSPTSKTTPPSPFFGMAAPPQSSPVHPYQTEAMKAVSSYQQKFGRSTFLPQDDLPSPTPSGDGNGGGAHDTNDEVSSFPAYSNVKVTNTPTIMQPFLSSAVSLATQSSVGGMSSAPVSLVSNLASRGPAKSRDPRLRHLNATAASMDVSFSPSLPVSSPASKLEPLGDLMNPRKFKAPEHPAVDSPAAKRQRNGLDAVREPTNVFEARNTPRTIGSEINTVASPQAASRGLVRRPTDPRKSGSVAASSVISNLVPSVPTDTISSSLVNGSTADSLQSLLKGIAGNPAAWVSMFKEQQRSSDPVPNVSQSGNMNSAVGQVTLPTTSSTNVSGAAQTSVAMLQASLQNAAMSSQDDATKLRMKPRDPRRVLQTNAAQRTGASVVEQLKANGNQNASSQGVSTNSSIQRNVNVTNVNSASSLAPIFPDIANQFTKSLKNIAEIVSVPQASSAQSSTSTSSPQSMQVDLSRVSVASGGPVTTSDQQAGLALRPGEVVAGRPQSQNQWGDVEHLFEGFDDQQRAAIQQERSRRIGEQKKMFAAHKLCLVLDLDHTLLNSAKFMEVDPTHDEILRKKEEQDREKPRRHLFRFPHMGMWTKLRPGIWNFLEKASKLFELHLYTMGNKLYATEMAKVLDPKGTLFAGRVISRGDDGDPIDGDERVPKIKDLDGVLGMESAVLIIDDSVRVWPHNKLNLIVVERYTYFPCSRRQFGLSGPSLLEIDHDERPEQGTLALSLAVIERIHQNFFANESLDDVDVRSILASEQRKILGGCRILFSRVFPVGEANPHMHPLWQTAEQFGAVCTTQIDDQVTHVVANSLGTDKVNWGLSTGRFVVHPNWVEASALLYRRANEQDFAVKS